MNIPTGAAQYLARFADQQISCSQYALQKMGVDKTSSFIKIDEYTILCAPFQLGFKRGIFLASLSKQEMTFFQRYLNGIVGVSMVFTQANRKEPLKLFIRGSLAAIGPMKGKDNVGLLVVDYKNSPDDYVTILGSHLEHMELLRAKWEDFGKSMIKMSPDTAQLMGYNMYATITEPQKGGSRIQVFALSSQKIEHLESMNSPERPAGTAVAYQLYFRKYRIAVGGTIEQTVRLPTGIVKTLASLAFSPELVEILDDYQFAERAKRLNSAQQ
ncbi:PilZN3 domain-containing protein [Gracilinema caldarium]|uniref:PilZN3 domain-containing protein n=1 Tax=Gracilinema caldarium TaxID=215591 RepID=UPI0026ED7290|nr:PilZN3 domain-containing protein [Gracilinema caldarium]